MTGDQPYLDNKLRQKFKSLIPKDIQTINFATYDMETTPIDFAINDATSVPFFGCHRLIFIDHTKLLTNKNTGKIKHDIDELVQYVEHPELTSIVVFFLKEKLDSRNKFIRTLKKQAEIVDLTELGERQIKNLVTDRLVTDGYMIDKTTLEQLQQRTAGNLSLMMNEIPKLEMACYDTKTVTSHDVEELVPKMIDQNVFDLVNAVIAKNIDKSLTIYRNLILNKEEPLIINAVLVRQFRLLIQCHIMDRNGYSHDKIVSTLNIHPYRVKLAFKILRNLQHIKLHQIYNGLVNIEKELKSTSQDPFILFELFMLKYSSQVF